MPVLQLLRPTSSILHNLPRTLLRYKPLPLKPYSRIYRSLTTTPPIKMPEPLKAEHIDSKTDPTVANQWDSETPKPQQIEEFYKTVDGMKIGLLTTIRDGIGPVARSMAVAKVSIPLFPL